MADYESSDKLWAKRYILDPLTAPEPSQETGPGSSHFNVHLRTSRPISVASPPSTPRRRADSKKTSSHRRAFAKYSPSASSDDDDDDTTKNNLADQRTSANFFNNPTPPESAGFHKSPGQYHTSNPYSACRSRSRRTSNLDTHHEEARSHRSGLVSPPQSPDSVASDSVVAAQPSALPATAAYHSGRLPIRSASARAPGPASRPRRRNPDQHGRSRSDDPFHNHHQQTPRPPGSLGQRYPGDMSHRPLDMIRRETRAADRRHRRHCSEADTIDLLDTVGPTYHHDGPYDATLASRNMNKLYSPVEAVRDSNLAALAATPQHFIRDALTHHRPLQGTATIPSGGVDARGNRMSYEEGADLMREPDAPGGAYRRYDFIDYLPDDLKGKGEPSYTIERDIKRGNGGREDAIEMESNPLMAKSLRHRKSASVGESSSSNVSHTVNGADEHGLGRHNSTGRRISEGLKRRFGSLRRKKSPSPDRH
ncbi:hypothetical protein V2A60_003120 [Cordyceps javanica]|uniref:Protein kinase n=1 Tax=Cordyceps javanica TaxID=43265 RepID=A0A545W1D0_9HYPO|nr:protein kinase [Cordyceps javanica]TQW07769.1 protein kinase [Cordyceps javanica]